MARTWKEISSGIHSKKPRLSTLFCSKVMSETRFSHFWWPWPWPFEYLEQIFHCSCHYIAGWTCVFWWRLGLICSPGEADKQTNKQTNRQTNKQTNKRNWSTYLKKSKISSSNKQTDQHTWRNRRFRQVMNAHKVRKPDEIITIGKNIPSLLGKESEHKMFANFSMSKMTKRQ
jgi:hypothetical protein